MRIAVEATPAVTQTAGVGRYTRELLRALVQLPAEDQYLLVAAATNEQSEDLLKWLPPGAWREIRRLPAGPRAMTVVWQRLRIPVTVERLAGAFDVLHGTDFVVPPTRKPSVVTIHDLSYLHYPEFAQPELVDYLKKAVPRSLRRADAVIAVSAAVAAEIADAYPFAADRLVAIPNGVSLPEQSPEPAEEAPPTILTVGTVEPRKNHALLLDAMPRVWEAIPDARLVIAGRQGWQSEAISTRIRSASADERVCWYEDVDDERLDDLYRSAAAFAYPSWYEGFGLPILEAMARGVPVVTSTAAALRETGGDAALYADGADPEQLAVVLCSVLEDTELNRDLSERGRRRAEAYTWHETARRTQRIYRLVAEGTGT